MTLAKIKLYISLFLLTFGVGLFALALPAEAATLFLAAPQTELKIGQTAEVTMRVDSAGQSFNAAQATLNFPKDILQIKSIDYSSAASAFNFWLQDPQFSNQDGTTSFIGGSTSGLDGAAVSLLKIVFVAKGNGSAPISITNAAVTAADGSGTNILSKIIPLTISVSPTILSAPAPVAFATTSATAIYPVPEAALTATSSIIISVGPPPPPVQIARKPIRAASLPAKPTLTVPIYPDQTAWYNVTTNFLVQWELPADISQVATAINQNPTYDHTNSEGLFEQKVFPALTDGVWYLHVRFKNNVGWGPTMHWHISLDTAPPVPFTIQSSDGLKTDSPQPTLSFQTSDGLSGIAHYLIQVDNGNIISQEANSYTLPRLTPGNHTISVKAVDKAGNSAAQTIQLEITPITSPIITSLQQNIFVGEGNLTIGGSALANTTIQLELKAPSGAVMATTEAVTNGQGNWQGNFNHPLIKGRYFIEATARDSRGALSLPIRSDTITVRDRPLAVISGIEITWIWVYTVSVLLFIILIAWAYWWFKHWKNRAQKRATIGERDIVNFSIGLKANLQKVADILSQKPLRQTKLEEARFAVEELQKQSEKIEKYIVENIKEIPE